MRAEPTWTEARLWQELRRLPIRVRRQAPIGPYVVDFACLRAKLVIEVDGGVHQLPQVAARDIERDAWLTGQGFYVLRIDSQRIPAELTAVVEEIAAAIAQRVPLPLEGEGARGWGGGSEQPDEAREARTVRSRRTALDLNHPATTPSQPSPLEGEGS